MHTTGKKHELIRAMGLKIIKELLNSRSKKDFKRDMLKERNLKSKFESHNFDIQKLWAKNPEIPFDAIANNSKKINFDLRFLQIWHYTGR